MHERALGMFACHGKCPCDCEDSTLSAEKTKAAWREEIEKLPTGAESDAGGREALEFGAGGQGEAPDGMVPMEDDEDADRKVQESRARREVGAVVGLLASC